VTGTSVSVSPTADTTYTLSAIGPGGTTNQSVAVTVYPDLSVQVTPSATSLIAGQSQQFVATLSGGFSCNVNWSLVTDGGSIDGTGLFRAPLVTGTFQVAATCPYNPLHPGVATVDVVRPAAGTIDTSFGNGSVSIQSAICSQGKSMYQSGRSVWVGSLDSCVGSTCSKTTCLSRFDEDTGTVDPSFASGQLIAWTHQAFSVGAPSEDGAFLQTFFTGPSFIELDPTGNQTAVLSPPVGFPGAVVFGEGEWWLATNSGVVGLLRDGGVDPTWWNGGVGLNPPLPDNDTLFFKQALWNHTTENLWLAGVKASSNNHGVGDVRVEVVDSIGSQVIGYNGLHLEGDGGVDSMSQDGNGDVLLAGRRQIGTYVAWFYPDAGSNQSFGLFGTASLGAGAIPVEALIQPDGSVLAALSGGTLGPVVQLNHAGAQNYSWGDGGTLDLPVGETWSPWGMIQYDESRVLLGVNVITDGGQDIRLVRIWN
jgi:hypothetical protein